MAIRAAAITKARAPALEEVTVVAVVKVPVRALAIPAELFFCL